jgi:hypothetical protein
VGWDGKKSLTEEKLIDSINSNRLIQEAVDGIHAYKGSKKAWKIRRGNDAWR